MMHKLKEEGNTADISGGPVAEWKTMMHKLKVKVEAGLQTLLLVCCRVENDDA
jgi:hypothetical protein